MTDDRLTPEITLTTPQEHVDDAITVRPGGLVGPADALPTQTEMSLKDFHQNGILWWLNHALLWDLGLALAVDVEPLLPNEGENSRRYQRLFILEHVPPQRIVEADDAKEYEAFQRWLSNRAGTVR
jgi:hypothetical protein